MEKIKVKIKPNSSESKIIEKGLVWKINIKAPAQENKANIELLKFLKRELKKNIKIVSGLKSKEKVLEIF